MWIVEGLGIQASSLNVCAPESFLPACKLLLVLDSNRLGQIDEVFGCLRKVDKIPENISFYY